MVQNNLTKSNEVTSSAVIDRLEKHVKGSLTFILILGIIKAEKRTYGWYIKKRLKEITKAKDYIKDSSLYTILRNLENNYGLVQSEMVEKRRYYSITPQGNREIEKIVKFWQELLDTSKTALSTLNIAIKAQFVEED